MERASLPHQDLDPATAMEAEVGGFPVILDQLLDLWEKFLRSTPRLAIAVVIVLATWLCASVLQRVVRRVMARGHLRHSLRDLVRQLLYAFVWVIGILVAANVLFPSLTPGRTLAALGVGSIAIGFAFKDIFENFFAGVLILWRFPFENGDFIRCGDIMGRVEETTIRMTLVRQVDGRLLVVPNARLFKDPVEILTAQENARIEAIVGIAYKEDIATAREVIHGAVAELPTVVRSEPIDVQVVAFGSSSVDLRVIWWTGAEPQARRESLDEVLAATKQALDAAGIEIPFPHRTLVFDAGIPVRIGSDTEIDAEPEPVDASGK